MKFQLILCSILQTRASLTIKAERRKESEIRNVSAICKILAQLINKLKPVPMTSSWSLVWLTVNVSCGCLPQARSFASISLLLSLLNFLMGTNTLLDEIPTYFVLDFLQRKLHWQSKLKGEESRKSATCLPSLKFRLNLLINLKRSQW